MSRTAFIFTSPRDKIVARMQTGEEADTALHGLNYLAGAEYFTIPPQSLKALLFIPRLLRFDFIIAQDNLLLGYFVSTWSRLWRRKTKWLYVAVNSSILMRRHASHPIHLFLLKRFWTSYDRIICLSSGQLEDFVQLGIPRTHLIFIPFGVDAYFFQPTGASHEGDIIVSVGRDAGRDYGTLFKAAEHSNHAFVVVAAEKNIPPDVSIPANVSVFYNLTLAEIRDLYKRARLVVIASKDQSILVGSDCSGQTVVLDALAAGKAVVATDRLWITDYFIPDQDLVVVPPSDPEALTQAVIALWDDTEKRKLLAASGQAKVTRQYTTKIFAQNLLKLINSMT